MLAHTLFAYLIMRFGIRVGGFVPKTYVQQVVENSDFRKYDDGLRMILDCTPELERALKAAAEGGRGHGIVRYGVHRQDAAMMTCFTPSAMRGDHVHFIDGARGGYASAATALKAMAGLKLQGRDSAPGAGPGFAAAQHADAAFDPQRVRARHRDIAGIDVAVVGIVDLARPFAGPDGRMPINSGSPIIGRLASAGFGFLSSTAGLPVAGSIGSLSQTMTPQMPPPHLLNLHLARRRPGSARCRSGRRLRCALAAGAANRRRQKQRRSEIGKSASHEAPRKSQAPCIPANRICAMPAAWHISGMITAF